MRRLLRSIVLVLVVLMAAAPGCRQKEKNPPPAAPPQKITPVKKTPDRVVVPPAVKGKWKAVKIAVMDKGTNTKAIYTIDIGSKFPIPCTGLTLKVNYFLPAFIMDGKTMTSISNEPKNPAAQVEITDHGREIFKGWLFSLYPGTHAFRHPRFSFTLVDFVRAKKKRG
jgi:hypothetical protein